MRCIRYLLVWTVLWGMGQTSQADDPYIIDLYIDARGVVKSPQLNLEALEKASTIALFFPEVVTSRDREEKNTNSYASESYDASFDGDIEVVTLKEGDASLSPRAPSRTLDREGGNPVLGPNEYPIDLPIFYEALGHILQRLGEQLKGIKECAATTLSISAEDHVIYGRPFYQSGVPEVLDIFLTRLIEKSPALQSFSIQNVTLFPKAQSFLDALNKKFVVPLEQEISSMLVSSSYMPVSPDSSQASDISLVLNHIWYSFPDTPEEKELSRRSSDLLIALQESFPKGVQAVGSPMGAHI